jgi:hypothetical protein
MEYEGSIGDEKNDAVAVAEICIDACSVPMLES